MKNNFKKNGNMRVRYETAEERREILRILEEQRGFRIDEEQKKVREIHPMSTRTFDINLKFRTIRYGIQPFIGAAMMSSGIRFYSAQEFFRIAELGFRAVPRYPVFHVPHAGWRFPFELLPSVCVSEERFRRYHDLMSDTAAWMLVPEAYRGGDMYERFQVSRLMCDVERFIGPEEEMERYGMGFCYEKAFDGTTIRTVTDVVKAQARKYYDEHHARMNSICERHPRILLLDIHSFSKEALPVHLRKWADSLPDVCIGTDPKYTPGELARRVRRRVDEVNLTSRDNIPYGGTFVPGSVLDGSCSCDLVSVMLEFNRDLYCDGDGKPVEARAGQIRKLVRRILADCADLD
uniref:Putative N-formylglutamate amidohydrolase n=1 Tax=uncultured bacterium Contig46 TaxID=1393580 RepID=W0FMV9_9BACT|nr:putative N-formylglutamate amidohydrolase [uncultured bacterium Contig46]